MAVAFPSSFNELVHLLQKSQYLVDLCGNEKEQVLKHKRAILNLDDLTKFYAGQTQYANKSDQAFIQQCVEYLYHLYPSLPATTVYFVIISPTKQLEFGNTSFTINNVVFLHPQAVHNPETVMHEVVHVIQRNNPDWFEKLCASMSFFPANLRVTELDGCSVNVISNPDAEVFYADDRNEIIAYDIHLMPVAINLKNNRCSPLQDELVELMGVRMKRDSVSEMMAVRLTKDMYTSDLDCVKVVNSLLTPCKSGFDLSLVVVLVIGGLLSLMH